MPVKSPEGVYTFIFFAFFKKKEGRGSVELLRHWSDPAPLYSIIRPDLAFCLAKVDSLKSVTMRIDKSYNLPV